MPGFITAPYDLAPPNLDTVPSSAGERVDPMATLDMLDRAARRGAAEFGVTDPASGEQIAPPEPSVPAADLQKRWGVQGPTPGLSLNFTAPLPESVARDMNRAKLDEIARANAQARSPGGVGSALADFGLGFLDPVGLAASALPVVGEARMAALLGRAGIDLGESFAARTALRAGAGAASGAIGNAPLVGLRLALSQQEQADYGMYDAARDMAFGAALGGVLHPLLGAAADAFAALRRPAVSPESDAAAMQGATASVLDDAPVNVAPVAAAAPALLERRDTTRIYAPGVPPIEARPEVVPIESLIASHDADGRVNDAYPHAAGLQLRDRTTLAALTQIPEIANNLQPERLGISPEAGLGAPIVGPTDAVESGNGRTLALRQVYASPALADRAGAYKAWLTAQGFDLTGIDHPVLIARRVTDLTPEQASAFAGAANERPTLAMNAAEQAKADAGRAGAALGQWRGGDLGSAANRDFVRAFMAELPHGERGGMVLPDGSLSSDGLRRIQSALFAHAYGDALGGTLGRMLTGETDNMRSIAGGLSDAAGAWARMRQAVAEGRSPAGLDATRALAEAVQLLEQSRKSGIPPIELLMQADFERPPPSADAQALLSVMFRDQAMRRPIGRDALADLLTRYAGGAERTQAGPDMFGQPPPTARDLLHALTRADAAAPQPRLGPVTDAETLRQADMAAKAAPVADSEIPREVRDSSPERESVLPEPKQPEPELPTLADEHVARLAPEQGRRLIAIYAAAAEGKPKFDGALAEIAAKVGGRLIAPPLKGTKRAVEKILGDYAGDASKIKDIPRATIDVETPAQALEALRLVRERMDLLPAGQRDTITGEPGPDGYRDIKVNARVNGIVAEVQINLRAMLAAKDEAHPIYEEQQALERAARDRQRTPEEDSRLQELLAQQKAIYDRAFASLRADETSARNASSDTAAPLRRAEDESNTRGGSVSQAVEENGDPGILPSDTGMPSTSKNSMRGLSTEASNRPGGASIPDIGTAADRVNFEAARAAGLLDATDMADMTRIETEAAQAEGEARALEAAGACMMARSA